jgi:hypothetical protein
MADAKISELTAYTTPISTDLFVIVDISTTTTKKITFSDLKSAMAGRLAPTGTVDGVNASFVFTIAPSIIFVDGVAKQKVASDGTVNWTGTTTCVLAVAPTFDVFGL